MIWLTDRIYPLLQLTRAALVFTAISNSFAELLLRARWAARATGDAAYTAPDPLLFVIVALMSAGMYGYGMSLNDIIDRRRDLQLAADRPLPSGRIGVLTAHVICALCAVAALVGGAWYLATAHVGAMSIILVVWTLLLITFYDFAGKYLVWPGLVTLGLIRLFHCVIPAPEVPLIWHPLLLFNHVTILSAVAYVLEEKRPALTRGHWWAIAGGIATINLSLIGLAILRRGGRGIIEGLWITPHLAAPLAAALVFILLALVICRFSSGQRQAGRTMMLFGLLWLIVYDALFVGGYVGWLEGTLLLVLLPLAYLSVRVMRTWGRLISLSQRPTFKRVE